MYRWVEAVGKTWPKDANSQLPTRNSRLPWYSRFYSITLGGAKELWRCFWWIFSRFLFTFHCLILVEFHTLGNRMLWLKYIYILYLYYTYIYINYLYIYIFRYLYKNLPPSLSVLCVFLYNFLETWIYICLSNFFSGLRTRYYLSLYSAFCLSYLVNSVSLSLFLLTFLNLLVFHLMLFMLCYFEMFHLILYSVVIYI